MDEFCGSSAEYFFYLCRQSDKVTSYGLPTVGMMDYEGMSVPTAMPYTPFMLYIPIAKSSWIERRPIDETGFMPAVPLSIPTAMD
jgi:hypothetical protein